ncbi:hypothetical protein [uncultured Streptomyces sp.]|uniref:hypothetical protein n=1 Tax=uncultured Streptomyces sp. TaxID=174707 RepID=UPI00261AA9F2|nr:hypothetical protein [uncultured Streptomyces sp.]
MDNTCSICHQHAPAACYLCDACTYRVHTWLGGIPRTLPLLRAALVPTTGPAQRGGSGRAHSPLPVDVRALDLLGPGQPVPVVDPHGDQAGGIPIGALLAGWARYLATEVPAVWTDAHGTVRIDRCTDARPRSGTGITAWTTWLQRYLPYAATRPWAEDFYRQLEDLVARIQRITDTRPRRTPMDAPCPACTAFGLARREGEQHIGCEACGHRLLPAAYAAHRDQVMHLAVLMAAAQHTTPHAPAA